MIKLSVNNAILTGLLGMICICVAVFIILPSTQDIINLSKEIEKQRENLETMYLKGQSLKATHVEFKKIQDDLYKIDGILLQPGQELEFITALETVASNNQVEQDIQLDTNNIRTTAGFNTMPVHLNLAGRYHDLMGYLIDLEKLNYYLNFKTLIFSNEAAQIENSKFNITHPVSLAEPTTGEADEIIRLTIEAESYWVNTVQPQTTN